MSLRAVSLACVVLSAALLAGCGGANAPSATAPPTQSQNRY